MRSLPRSSSTNTSTGVMPAASAARSASSPSSTKRPGAPALLRLAERARGLDAPVGAARDHAGIPLSAATGPHAACAPTVSAQASSRAWPPQRARVQQAPERRHRGAVGDGEAAEARIAAVAEQAREGRQPRRDRPRPRPARRSGCGGLGADAALRPEPVGGRVDLTAGGSQRRRDRVEQPVDLGALARVCGEEVVAALASGQVAEDRVRFGQHDVAVDQRRDAAERVDREVPVGPRRLERHRAPLVGEPEHAQQEPHLLRVRRARVIVESHPLPKRITARAPPWRARRAPRTSSARAPPGRPAPCGRR